MKISKLSNKNQSPKLVYNKSQSPNFEILEHVTLDSNNTAIVKKKPLLVPSTKLLIEQHIKR